jgi:hypothetical protein
MQEEVLLLFHRAEAGLGETKWRESLPGCRRISQIRSCSNDAKKGVLLFSVREKFENKNSVETQDKICAGSTNRDRHRCSRMSGKCTNPIRSTRVSDPANHFTGVANRADR